MNVATIVDVRPTGEEPFPGQYGILYPFLVTFDDNTSGKANCKTQKPPYKAGDKVGYEVTGQFKGKNNIKITKNPDKPFGSAPAPQVQPPYQPPAQPRQAVPALPPGTDYDIGMRAQAALYVECILWADRVNGKLDALGHVPLTEEHWQACVSSLYIQANRDGLRVPSQASNRPTGALKSPETASQTDDNIPF